MLYNLQRIQGLFQRVLPRLSYIPILVAAAFLAFLRVVLYAQLLDVGSFGLLSKMLLVSGIFGVAGSLGFHLLAHRELPALFIHGRYRRGIILLSRGAIVTSLVVLCLAVLPFLGAQPLGMVGIAFALSLMHGWGQQIFMLSVIESKSRLEMKRYSVYIFTKVALSTVGGIAASVASENALLVVAAEFIITLIITIGVAKKILYKYRLHLAVVVLIAVKEQTTREWKTASVLLVTSLLAFFSFNADRWVAASLLSINEFGIYSFAWITLMAAQSVQYMLNTGFFPILVRRHASVPGFGAFRLVRVVSFVTLISGVLVAIIGSALVSWGTSRWYPGYVSALPLLPYLMVAAVFRVADFWSSYLVAIHRESTLLGVQVVILFLLPALWLIYDTKMGLPISSDSLAQLALLLAVSNYTANLIIAYFYRNPVRR